MKFSFISYLEDPGYCLADGGGRRSLSFTSLRSNDGMLDEIITFKLE